VGLQPSAEEKSGTASGDGRGTALQEIGVYGNPIDIRNKQDNHTAELYVDEAVVEQFKNYKDFDKEALKNQWTWWRVGVEYDFKPVAEHKSLFRNIRNTLMITMLMFGWVYAYEAQIADLAKELKKYIKNNAVNPSRRR
jgi:hypothetical protein